MFAKIWGQKLGRASQAIIDSFSLQIQWRRLRSWCRVYRLNLVSWGFLRARRVVLLILITSIRRKAHPSSTWPGIRPNDSFPSDIAWPLCRYVLQLKLLVCSMRSHLEIRAEICKEVTAKENLFFEKKWGTCPTINFKCSYQKNITFFKRWYLLNKYENSFFKWPTFRAL